MDEEKTVSEEKDGDESCKDVGDELEEGEISDEEEAIESTKKSANSSSSSTSSNSRHKKSESPKGNDIEEFLKKKREDLQQKVKNQLELAGYRATVSEGTDKDPDMVLPDSLEKKEVSSPSKSKKPKSEPVTERQPGRKGHRYHDLDPEPLNAADPHEAMINSWLSHKKPKKQDSEFGGFGSPEDNSGYDPNDEFYFGTRSSPVDPAPSESSGDKDYRSSREDKDYRWSSSGQKDYAGEGERRINDSPEPSRSVSNEYGDRDYRHSERSSRTSRTFREKDKGTRRKRHSGGSEDEFEDEDGRKSREDSRRKRFRRSVSPLRRRSSRWDRTSICKFFRDGYCRDGEDCSYSHNAADSLRKPEVCKYYQQGYCKKSQGCPFLHGEYPCKAFHKGECSKGDECPYSHTALNDFTRPIFDQMISDEELASKIKIPQVPTKRKVLLGLPPPLQPPSGPNNMMNNVNMMGPGPRGPMPMFDGPIPSQQGAPMPQFMDSNSSMQSGFPGTGPNTPVMPGFPPSNFIPPNMPPAAPTPSSAESVQSGRQSTFKHDEEIKREPQEEEQVKSESSTPSYNISEMLRKIRATVQAEEETEDSPASPPPQTPSKSELSAPQNIPFHGIPKYRLIPFEVSPPTVDPALLTKSLTDNKLRNDPRIKKLLDSQFNAVSNMITSQKAASSADSKPAKDRTDPRVSAARDPRLAKQGPSVSAADSPKQQQQPMDTSPPPTSTESQMQEMIKMQLQMAAAMQMPPGMMGNAMNMPVGPPSMGMGGPMLAGPGPGPQGPPMFNNHGPMLGGGPSPGPSMINQGPPGGGGMNSGGWMPQFGGPSLGMDNNFGGGPPLGIPPPGLISGPVSLSTPVTSSTDIVTTVSSDGSRLSKDPRNRPSRWNRSPPSYQASPTNYSENVPPNQEDFVETSPLLDSKPVSLREKRKDLQYESPLAAGQSRIPAGSEASRYNEMPNVKVKRKTSPLMPD